MEERDKFELEPNWYEIKNDIKIQIGIFGCDIGRENSLIITSISLLYLVFTNAYHTGYNGRIEQHIRCFTVLFQSTKLS